MGLTVVTCAASVGEHERDDGGPSTTFDGKKDLPIRHIPGPEGVRGRNSDNALILEKLGWEPTIRLADGLKVTYFWIKSQLEEVRLLPVHIVSSPTALSMHQQQVTAP